MAQGLEALALVIGWLGVPVGYAALAMRVGGSRLEADFQPWERVTPLAVSFSFMVEAHSPGAKRSLQQQVTDRACSRGTGWEHCSRSHTGLLDRVLLTQSHINACAFFPPGSIELGLLLVMWLI